MFFSQIYMFDRDPGLYVTIPTYTGFPSLAVNNTALFLNNNILQRFRLIFVTVHVEFSSSTNVMDFQSQRWWSHWLIGSKTNGTGRIVQTR